MTQLGRAVHRLTGEDEQTFERLWRQLGLSVDWSTTYSTIGERSQRILPAAFLRLVGRGEAYQAKAPTMRDVGFQTTVANAEVIEKDVSGAYHRLAFTVDGEVVPIETTCPELLAACVALVAHADDERYARFVGKDAVSPLFGVRVPVLVHAVAALNTDWLISRQRFFGIPIPVWYPLDGDGRSNMPNVSSGFL